MWYICPLKFDTSALLNLIHLPPYIWYISPSYIWYICPPYIWYISPPYIWYISPLIFDTSVPLIFDTSVPLILDTSVPLILDTSCGMFSVANITEMFAHSLTHSAFCFSHILLATFGACEDIVALQSTFCPTVYFFPVAWLVICSTLSKLGQYLHLL